MMPEISIIVPVYNAEKYLNRCVDSILVQTLEALELLLIDDGSNDKSGQICDDYASKDARVRVIHQQNAGVSAARNAGIAAANGEFIGFVDADDWIAPEMFRTLYGIAQGDDFQIVICDARTAYSDGREEPDTIVQLPESIDLNKETLTPKLLTELAGSVWRCIYRRELITAHEITFPVGVKFSEDRVFNLICLGFAEKIRYIKEPYYFRYVNTESAVHRFHADYFESCLAADTAIGQAIETAWGGREEYRVAYLRKLVTGAVAAICNYYYRTSTMSRKERRAAVMRVCMNERVRDAITRTEATDIRVKWLLCGNVNMLIFYAKLANWKHGR